MNAVVLEQFFGSVRGDYLERIGGGDDDDDDDVDGGDYRVLTKLMQIAKL